MEWRREIAVECEGLKTGKWLIINPNPVNVSADRARREPVSLFAIYDLLLTLNARGKQKTYQRG